MHRPQVSSLFPYTTLFRSNLLLVKTQARTQCLPCARATNTRARALYEVTPEVSSNSVECGIDRKSTRLNSSHLVISYAVFCLKKKKLNDTYNILKGKRIQS